MCNQLYWELGRWDTDAKALQNIKKQIGEYEIWVDQGFPHSGEAAGIVVGLVP